MVDGDAARYLYCSNRTRQFNKDLERYAGQV